MFRYKIVLSLLKFQNLFEQMLHQPQQKTYLLAVSGGVDSMVLADLFQVSGFNFHIAHINYHLRNEDSNLDQKLVSDFCEKHKTPMPGSSLLGAAFRTRTEDLLFTKQLL